MSVMNSTCPTEITMHLLSSRKALNSPSMPTPTLTPTPTTKTEVVKAAAASDATANAGDIVVHDLSQVLRKHGERAEDVLGRGEILAAYASHVDAALDTVLYDFTKSYADSALASRRKKVD